MAPEALLLLALLAPILTLATLRAAARHEARTEAAFPPEGRILDVSDDTLLVSIEAEPDRLDDVEQQLRPYGIRSIQRTGRIALPRLAGAEPAGASAGAAAGR